MNEPGSATERTLLSRSAFIFAIRFFPAAASLAVMILFSHVLPKELNGLYQQLWVYLAILLAIACFGIPPLMLTHTPKSVHRWLLGFKGRHAALYGIWLCMLAIVFVILFRNKPIFNPWMLATLLAAQVWILLIETYLIINRKFPMLAAVSLVYALCFCAAHYAYLMHIVSFSELLWAIVLLSVARVFILVITARKTYASETSLLRRSAVPMRIRKQWTQLGIYDVSQVAFRWIDKLLISFVVGPAQFSVYLIGTTDVPFMSMLLSAAGNGLLQQMAGGEGSKQERLKLVNYSGAMLARIVFPVFFFLFFFRAEFIGTIFSSNYLASIPLFGISILSLPLRAYNYTSVLQHLNKVKIINWGAVLDLTIALGLAYPMYLWKGLPGVVFAFMISSYVQAVFYLVNTARLMHCSIPELIPWKRWIVMLIVFGIAGIMLHDGLAHFFSSRLTLILGFLGTVVIIAAAVLPLIFKKKSYVKSRTSPLR